MAKQLKQKPEQPPVQRTARVQYHCRCYKLGDEYEMWILDPKSGTYNGPFPCTKEQCRVCNSSQAEIVT